MYSTNFFDYIKNKCPMCGFSIQYNHNQEVYYCLNCNTFSFDTYKSFYGPDYDQMVFSISFNIKEHRIVYYFLPQALDISTKGDYYRYKIVFSKVPYDANDFLKKFCTNYETLISNFNKYIILI